jgi:hypothetical protein
MPTGISPQAQTSRGVAETCQGDANEHGSPLQKFLRMSRAEAPHGRGGLPGNRVKHELSLGCEAGRFTQQRERGNFVPVHQKTARPKVSPFDPLGRDEMVGDGSRLV